jgi:hypothetical protein
MSETDEPPIEAMAAAQLLVELRVVAVERARLDAREVRLLARFSALRDDPARGGDYAADEVAAELTLTPMVAARRVEVAADMADRLPETVRALDDGVLDLQKATLIAERTRVLDKDKVPAVEATVLEFAPGRTVRQIRDKLNRVILKVDPDGANARRQRAARGAFVRFQPGPDGMAELLVFDRAENLRPIFDLLNTTARSAKAAGNPAGVEELRAKALRDVILGEKRERLVTELRVTIPANALAGASGQPGEIHGYGPIATKTLHDLSHSGNVFWRRIVTDPLTGNVLDVGKRRRHTRPLGEHVRTRDRHCVFPGCPRPAEDCQIDHTIEHARGGPTTAANLGTLCQHHNLMKQDTEWQLLQPQPGQYVWVSPTGVTYPVLPDHDTDQDPVGAA